MRNQYKVLFEKYQLVTEQTEEPVMKVDKGGNKAWYLNGELHRTDGPAIEYANGSKEWWVNGELHRTDGPAVERANGYKAWWVNGELHRTDGPAVEYPDGSKRWYLNGVEYTEEEWKEQIERQRLKELGNKQAGANIDF